MERLHGRAACIPGDADRARFLDNDSDNAAIVGLAAWFGIAPLGDGSDTLELRAADGASVDDTVDDPAGGAVSS